VEVLHHCLEVDLVVVETPLKRRHGLEAILMAVDIVVLDLMGTICFPPFPTSWMNTAGLKRSSGALVEWRDASRCACGLW
jgi:hypothetical protein